MEISKLTLEIFSNLEQQWLTTQLDSSTTTVTKKPRVRILSIDGGGTTAVAAAALVHLERQIQSKTGNSDARIVDFFDVIAGTGVGALIAAMINSDDGAGAGRPMFTAAEAVNIIAGRHNQLYKSKSIGIINRKQRLSEKSMERVLKEVFTRGVDGKVLTLKDTCKPMIVPCYDLNSSAPFVFSRADAVESDSFDFELWKVCRATSADPAVLKPFRFTSVDGRTACNAVDGGLVMNNPSAAVVTHVLNNKRDFPGVGGVEDLLVLSLGNGSVSGLTERKVRRSGWCRSEYIVGVVMDGVSETVDQMLGNAFCWNHADYVRIQANGYFNGGVGPKKTEEVLKQRGVESLPFGGKRLLTETNGERIETFVQRLLGSSSSLPPSPCKAAAVSQLVNGR